jgi:hypothetical protein
MAYLVSFKNSGGCPTLCADSFKNSGALDCRLMPPAG